MTPLNNTAIKSALFSLAPYFRVSSLADSFFSAFFTAGKDDITPTLLSRISPSTKDISAPSSHSLVCWYVQENNRRLHIAKRRFQTWCLERGIRYLEADAGNELFFCQIHQLTRNLPHCCARAFLNGIFGSMA